MALKKIFVSLLTLSIATVISACEKNNQTKNCMVLFYIGKVKITDSITSQTRSPKIKGIIKENDIIETGPKANLVLQVHNMASIRIIENSRVKIDAILKKGKNTELSVENGKVFSKLKKLSRGSTYKVNTPNNFAAVRGTSFLTSYDAKEKKSSVAVHTGVVKVTPKINKQKSILVTKNKTAVIGLKKDMYTIRQNQIQQLELKKLHLHKFIKKPENKTVEEIKKNFQSKEIIKSEKAIADTITVLKELPKLSPLDRLRKLGKELTYFKLSRGQIIGHIVSQDKNIIKLDTGDGIVELPKRKIIKRRLFK